MTLNATATILGLALAGLATAAQADDRAEQARGQTDGPHRLQTVAHTATAGEPGHGWQYFADAHQHRAVAISPTGDYYLSRGHGLTRVFPAVAPDR